MTVVITGRIMDKGRLFGYRYWVVDGVRLSLGSVYLADLAVFLQRAHVLNGHVNPRTGHFVSDLNVPISLYPVYGLSGSIISYGLYPDSAFIAMALGLAWDDVILRVCGGLIAGAIMDPYSRRADRHAELYYEEIRKMSTDIQRIAKRTGFSIEDISIVKHHLFLKQHMLREGLQYFDASFIIAQSWQRLMTEGQPIHKHDITLLRHELYEAKLMSEGVSQDEAHIQASKEFNYDLESEEFYAALSKHSSGG